MKNYEICDCYIKEMQAVLLKVLYEKAEEAYGGYLAKRKLNSMIIRGVGYEEIWEDLEVITEANLYYEIYKVTGIDGLEVEE